MSVAGMLPVALLVRDAMAQPSATPDEGRARPTSSNDARCTTCGHGEYTHQQTRPRWCALDECPCRQFTTNLKG